MKKLILLIGILLTVNSCSKKNDPTLTPLEQLPEATQTGKGTFGCLINGEPFVVNNTSQQVAIYQGGQLQFGATLDINNNDESISFNLINPLENGIAYSLIEINYKSGYSKRKGNIICMYEFENTYAGNVIFTKIDRINYIISGTFEFSTNKNGCKDIKITNGRFDLKYIP